MLRIAIWRSATTQFYSTTVRSHHHLRPRGRLRSRSRGRLQSSRVSGRELQLRPSEHLPSCPMQLRNPSSRRMKGPLLLDLHVCLTQSHDCTGLAGRCQLACIVHGPCQLVSPAPESGQACLCQHSSGETRGHGRRHGSGWLIALTACSRLPSTSGTSLGLLPRWPRTLG